jgi:membrane protein required for colicin V production
VHFSVLDGLGLLLLTGFLALGFAHGLWWQVIRLLGVVASAAIARAVSPALGGFLLGALPGVDAPITAGIAWLLVFLAALTVASWLGRLGNSILESIHLGLLNRALGGVAGLGTGLALHLFVVAVVLAFAPESSVARACPTTFSGRAFRAVETRVDAILPPQPDRARDGGPSGSDPGSVTAPHETTPGSNRDAEGRIVR